MMGDPVYRKDEYAELPNASSEIKNVAGHFSSDHRVVLTGAQASPEAYQFSNAGQFSYIHFVAHGTANMTVPLDSSVVLSSNHDNVTVYKLYARDILKQNLHADLVTVSACNGSGVRNYSGEGLVGSSLGISPRRLAPCHRGHVGGQRCLDTVANGPSLRRTGQGQSAGYRTQVCKALFDSLRWSLSEAAVLGSLSALFRGVKYLRSPASVLNSQFADERPDASGRRVLEREPIKIPQPTVH